jgi:hypothetical protein
VELGFRIEDEPTWGSRLVAKPALRDVTGGEPRMSHARELARSYAELHQREIEQESILAETTRAALELVSEQMRDGMLERSEPIGAQVWRELEWIWHDSAPELDVGSLFRAQEAIAEPRHEDVATWIACAGTFQKFTNVGGHGPDWWPRIAPDVRANAVANLHEHADRIELALVVALRYPFAPARMISSEALLAATPSRDDERVFSALISVATGEGGTIPVAKLIAHLCTVSKPRVELLHRTIVASAVVAPETVAQDRTVQVAQRLAGVLARWSQDADAFAALYDCVRQRANHTYAYAVLCAAQVAPRAAWIEVLDDVRSSFPSAERHEIEAALRACREAAVPE